MSNEERLPELMSPDEVAAVLKVHPESVRRWCRLRMLVCVQVGRSWRVPRDEVRRALRDGLPVQPKGPRPQPGRDASDVLADMGRRVHLGGDDEERDPYRPGPEQRRLDLAE